MIDRIQLILKSKNLSSSQFADEIQVQRSSISHILSGRNKPSLDFVTKILSTYPEVNSDWLIFGKGQMVRQEKQDSKITEPTKPDIIVDEIKEEVKPKKEISSPTSQPKNNQETESLIDKILIFYKNGTFQEFFAK